MIKLSILQSTTCFLFAAVIMVSPSTIIAQKVSYNRDVRPILSQHCFACHGPDEAKREAGLRLDADEGIDFDEVIDRIESDDADYHMPPPEFKKPLNDNHRKILTQWIDQGAEYEKHWSFELPQKPEIPEEVHPIDFFVDRKLAKEGQKRSAKADPAILIRRLYLQLIGLPPTIEQADAFIAEPTTENFDAIVDQLLASPRYGERWARKWLDLARYADTNGYEKDRDRSIWPYRDWVIQAINDDMPFDQFTIEQLAGDMLPDATQSQRIATGFHRNTMLNEEGGIDPLEFRYHAMTDRVATTGTTWLGLTLGCAQCHTHKYDPVTHDDYFGIMAYLNNADEPDLYLEDDEKKASRQQKAIDLMAKLESHWPADSSLDQAFSAWSKIQKENLVDWKAIVPESMSTNMPNLSLEDDGVIFASGDTTKFDTYSLEFSGVDQNVTAIRLEALPDVRLPGGGPGMTYYEGRSGEFFLCEIQLTVDGKTIPWSGASETFAKNQFGSSKVTAGMAIDSDVQTGWSASGRSGFGHIAVFNLKEPLSRGTPFTLTMNFGRHFASSLGKFRVSVVDSDRAVQATLVARSDDDARMKQKFLMQAKEVEQHAEKIRKLLHPLQGKRTLVMRERSDSFPRKTFLRHRGEYTQPKHEVSVRLPEAISTNVLDTPTNRLDFAKWLVSRENPLTARVIANRHWAAFFGTGIVETVDDFGMQGRVPTHPKLLDYLAVELMDQGWSIKKLHRLIVTSETWQQSSVLNSQSGWADSLLAQFPRRRLEAEVIRDSALAASGLLSEKMFGPPVKPPQPEGAAANYSKSKWIASEGADRYRRSIYTYQKRTAPFAMFTTFDASSGEACIAKRDVSNTPMQALTLMNDPMFVEIAEALGKKVKASKGDTLQKVKFGFRSVLIRHPNESEIEMLTGFLDKHADWTSLARVLLCLDETITNN